MLVEEAIDEKAEITVSETAHLIRLLALFGLTRAVETFIYYSDGNSNQWVQTNPTSGGVIGSGGGRGRADCLCNHQRFATDGRNRNMALVDATDKLTFTVIRAGIRLRLLTRRPISVLLLATPCQLTEVQRSLQLLRLTQKDSATYSIVSDTSGNTATVTQGTGSNTNQWTITPSTNSADAGEFTLVFR